MSLRVNSADESFYIGADHETRLTDNYKLEDKFTEKIYHLTIEIFTEIK